MKEKVGEPTLIEFRRLNLKEKVGEPTFESSFIDRTFLSFFKDPILTTLREFIREKSISPCL